MYGKYNPDDILFKENIYKIDTSADTLSIFLPFADKGEMKLEQSEEELIVGVKNEVRRFFIQKEFRDKEIGGAKFEEGYLKIKFL